MVIHSHKAVESNNPVAEISRCLASELQAIESILHHVVESDSPLIREVGEYICLTSGKKLRPIMTLLTARAFGKQAEAPIHAAAAMEIIHVATLMHDDVIDKAAMRRGKPSVNARWGDDVAILMADYLYAAAFELALEHLDPEPLRLICQVTRRMCEGEMFQIERRGQRLGREDYLHLITCKTAYLFSACSAVGGMSGGLAGEELLRVTSFGMDFGLAFQITDDALDYVATDEHWGKSVGMDLVTGKQTLPLILTLQDATAEDRQQLEAMLSNGRDFAAISHLLDRYDAINRSLDVAQDYARQALSHLQGLPITDETAYEHLLALPDYVVNRRF